MKKIVKPEHTGVEIREIREEFKPKRARGTSQIKMINVSLMFGPDIVQQYTAWKAGTMHNPDVAIQTVDAAKALGEILVCDIKVMNHDWL